MSLRPVTTTSRSIEARTTQPINRTNVFLWMLQGLLAILFLFAGVAKLMMPVQILASQSGFPGLFMRFIAVAEVLGALGLILPRLLRLPSDLTPLAAAGLVNIMIGATVVTILTQGVAPALFPSIVGSLLIVIIRGRWKRVSGRKS